MMSSLNISARLKDQQARSQRQDIQHIKFLPDKTLIYQQDKTLTYVPTSTGLAAHNDDTFVRLMMGPYGSGKTTWALQEIVRRVGQMPRWHNNRRRARGLIIRNTQGELESTTLQSWLSWFGELGDIHSRKKPYMSYEHTFDDGHGIIELELIFLALDREDHLRKLKSLEATFAYVNELSETPQNLISHLVGRVNGRYPSKQQCSEPYWRGIIADTNPPDPDHWIFKTFEQDVLPDYKIFHQPPGLIREADDQPWQANTACDNYKNLSSNYYTLLAQGKTHDFVKVYCLGEYGSVSTGKAIYAEYNDDIHSRASISAIPGQPLFVGWDFGLTPALIVGQFSARGQLIILKEYTSEDMGIRRFATNVVMPQLQIDFPGLKIKKSVADPSGANRDQIMDELSCIGELCSIGIETEPAQTNNIDQRIAAVKYFLNMMTDGQPAFILSREGCPTLRKGFIKDYQYKRLKVSGEDRYHNEPNKNFASHPHDALQYLAMEFAADQIAAVKQGDKQPINMFNPVMQVL